MNAPSGQLRLRLSARPLALHWYEYVAVAVFLLAIAGYLPIVVHRTCFKGFGDAMMLVRPSVTADSYLQMWMGHLNGVVSGTPSAPIAAEINFTTYDMTGIALIGLVVWSGHRRFWLAASPQPLVAIAMLTVWRRNGEVAFSWLLTGWSVLMWFGLIAAEVEIFRPFRVVGLVTPATIGLILWGTFRLRQDMLAGYPSSTR